MVYFIWERLLRASYSIRDTSATLGGIKNSKKIYYYLGYKSIDRSVFDRNQPGLAIMNISNLFISIMMFLKF